MSWVSIREYTERTGLSTSTVRRQIRKRKVFAKKFGRDWYLQLSDDATSPYLEQDAAQSAGGPLTSLPETGNLEGVIEFSSKALHHYLILSEKLIAEKDIRLAERDVQLNEKKQECAELEGYVQLLEKEIERLKEKPEGWM